MTAAPATLRAARLLLHQLGVTPEQLQWEPVPCPTIAEYLPTVIAATGPGARRTYGTYWRRITAAWGDQQLDQLTPSQINALIQHPVPSSVPRRNTRGGTSAHEHLVAAIRAIYTHAIADGLLPAHHNPAAQVRKPHRPPSNRRALTAAELAEINHVVATTGNDVTLDTLLIRLHTETACRRRAAITLTTDDLDQHWCLLRLHEKNNNVRWQPVSSTLMAALVDHITARGNGTGPLLRYRNGTPITTRRHDHLWHRLGVHLPWIHTHNISTHWLRHTTITWVERHHGYGIARAYAGHTDTRTAPTTTYIRAQLPEIATALSALTGGPHPLATMSVER
jgi:integrase